VSVFVDTSALIALLAEQDPRHAEAAACWRELNESRETLVTSNYVVVEFLAVLQRRHGVRLVRAALDSVLLVIEVHWVDEQTHESALQALLAANRRDFSLVDCVSFVVMRDQGITTAFTLDPHFAEQGFEVMPDQSD